MNGKLPGARFLLLPPLVGYTITPNMDRLHHRDWGITSLADYWENTYFDKYITRGLDTRAAAIYGMVENIDQNVGRIYGIVIRSGSRADV